MKKSFIYLSSIIFTSLFTISSVDAFFGRKTAGPTAPTAAEREAGINFDATIKDLQIEKTTITKVLTSIAALQKKSQQIAQNTRTYSRDNDPAQIFAIVIPISMFREVATNMLGAQELFLSGLQSLKKSKTRGDSLQTSGTESVLQASQLSECAIWYQAQLNTMIVVLHRYLHSKEKQPAHAGEIQNLLNQVKLAFEDKKKAFGSGINKGETNAEAALIEDMSSAEESTQKGTLHNAIIELYDNTKIFTECEEILVSLIEAVIEYLEQGDLTPLTELSNQCEETVSGHQKAKEAEDIEDTMTTKRNKEFKYSKKPRFKEYEDLPSRKRQAVRNHR